MSSEVRSRQHGERIGATRLSDTGVTITVECVARQRDGDPWESAVHLKLDGDEALRLTLDDAVNLANALTNAARDGREPGGVIPS